MSLGGEGIVVAGREYPLSETSRVVVVGAGKATFAIAAALEARLGERIDAGLIAVRHDQETTPLGIEVAVADHPLPSERSADVAGRLLAMVEPLGPEDLVLACFTGGSSALASLPPEGVTIAEKRDLHELLLASGMPISAINTVRKHVSSFKGGRLAAARGAGAGGQPDRLRRRRRRPRPAHRPLGPGHLDRRRRPLGPARLRPLGPRPRPRSAPTSNPTPPNRRASIPTSSTPSCWSPATAPARR